MADKKTVKVKITRDTYVDGEFVPANIGTDKERKDSIIDVSDRVAKDLVNAGKAEFVGDAPRKGPKAGEAI